LTGDVETSYQPEDDKEKLNAKTEKFVCQLAIYIKRLSFRYRKYSVLTMISKRWLDLLNPKMLNHEPPHPLAP